MNKKLMILLLVTAQFCTTRSDNMIHTLELDSYPETVYKRLRALNVPDSCAQCITAVKHHKDCSQLCKDLVPASNSTSTKK